MYSIELWRNDERLAMAEGITQANLYYEGKYDVGDFLLFKTPQPFCKVQVDQSIGEAEVFVPSKTFRYVIPISDDLPLAYPPEAFCSLKHLISIGEAPFEGRRNLALNPIAKRENEGVYPYIHANVETRDESVFFARNVIDGVHIANGHGEWPYQSWGIGAREDAEITLDFGREVVIDEMALYLRADFPHDAYWVKATVVLSNGFSKTFDLQAIEGAQYIELGEQKVSWIKMHKLIKCDMPSAFPALKQWEVYGKEAEKL